MLTVRFLVLHLTLSVCGVCATRILFNNAAFDNAAAWESEYLPCPLDKIVFPEHYAAVLPLPSQVHVSGFILPADGAILLNGDMSIELAADMEPNKGRTCGSEKLAYLKQAQVQKWFDPDSWHMVTKAKAKQLNTANKALPDLQRVPCDNEPVIIAPKGALAIDLEHATYLRMGQLSLAGSLVSKEYLQYLLSTDLGQILFRNSKNAIVEYYHSGVCGCHREFDILTAPVCHNMQCAQPHCLQPITPYGACCQICGAMLHVAITRCDDVLLQKLKRLLEETRKTEDLVQHLDFDVSFYDSEEYGKFVQIVVVDRLDYEEQSVHFLNKFNASSTWRSIFPGTKHIDLLTAGRPYNPQVSYFSILLIVLCFIFVAVVSLVIFAHFTPNNELWQRLRRRWRAMLIRHETVFARFDNMNIGRRNTLSEGVQETSTNFDTDNLIMSYNAGSSRLCGNSFENPMFNKTPIDKMKLENEQPTLEVADITNDEVQELQEINLISSSDESDSEIEAETKE